MSTLESQVKDDEQKNSNLKKKILDFCKVSEAQTDRYSFKGACDPRYTKVLHVEHNPFQQEIDSEKKKMD